MDTPQVLLEHYLKQLRLPTMVREYRKLGEQCAKEGATFQHCCPKQDRVMPRPAEGKGL